MFKFLTVTALGVFNAIVIFQIGAASFLKFMIYLDEGSALKYLFLSKQYQLMMNWMISIPILIPVMLFSLCVSLGLLSSYSGYKLFEYGTKKLVTYIKHKSVRDDK